MNRLYITRTARAGCKKRMNRFITTVVGALIPLTCSMILPAHAPAAEPAAVRIKGLRRLEETVARLGGNGDNWHMSWTSDDRMVAGLCDGDAQPWSRIPHRPYNSRLIVIRGTPPKLDFEDLSGYPELLSGPGPRNFSRYYGFGILAQNGRIYQFLSTPDRPFDDKKPHP